MLNFIDFCFECFIHYPKYYHWFIFENFVDLIVFDLNGIEALTFVKPAGGESDGVLSPTKKKVF